MQDAVLTFRTGSQEMFTFNLMLRDPAGRQDKGKKRKEGGGRRVDLVTYF